ncbi:MAG TPA: C40 family peptidase [Jatrophihabitans sp.]|nr:C40 family peptidase [Jatrophihabitans sp.]
MAIRIARCVRPLIAVAAISAAAATAAPTLAGAAPHADPSIASVQKQLGELALRNSQLVEKFDHAQVLVQRREKAAAAARQQARSAELAYAGAHDKFRLMIQAQYESGGFGAAAALLDSSSDTNYLDRLQTLNVASKHMAQVVGNVSAARDDAEAASAKARNLLAQARHQRSVVVQARQDVQTQIKKYQSLLARLNSAQRAAYQRQINPKVSSANTQHLTKATSAAARRAVQFALDQVGKPYVFGAGGPGAYDCSGLTMAAWQHGGVSLPHSAADQYNYGHHVSRNDLQPGDLIFFYQPIGHVTIYIGDGLMVSAPTEGENVSVVPLSAFNSDYVGATRLVG